MNNELWTIGRMLAWTEQYFREKGIDSPRLDAEVLLSHLLGENRIYCYTHYDRPLEKQELAQFKRMILERINGNSVAYIVREKEFMGIPFMVTPAVLVPRPDTETLVEAVLDRVARDEEKHILDLCTGSGAVLLSLLHYLPSCTGVGVELSPTAIEVARENCQKLHLENRTALHEGDLWEPVEQIGEQFHVVVSNPPYIPTTEIDGLAKEVLKEPRMALDGGINGLVFYERILEKAHVYLHAGGLLAVEIGMGQEREIMAIAIRVGAYEEAELYQDIQGINRVIMWRKR